MKHPICIVSVDWDLIERTHQSPCLTPEETLMAAEEHALESHTDINDIFEQIMKGELNT